MRGREWVKPAIVEFIGPFFLVFAGVGAIIHTQGQNLVAIALAHGLAIGLSISAAGHISGGHFNPAVTAAMVLARRIEPPLAWIYVAAQLLGATLAAAALTAIYPDLGDVGRNTAGVNLGVPAVGAGIGTGGALLMEIVLTFFLVFVIFGVAVDHRTGGRAVAGLVIGLTIVADILAGGVVSGAVMNPARALGPAIVQQDFGDFWLWWLGPLIGAALAAIVYNEILLDGGRVGVATTPRGGRPPAVREPGVSDAPAADPGHDPGDAEPSPRALDRSRRSQRRRR